MGYNGNRNNGNKWIDDKRATFLLRVLSVEIFKYYWNSFRCNPSHMRGSPKTGTGLLAASAGRWNTARPTTCSSYRPPILAEHLKYFLVMCIQTIFTVNLTVIRGGMVGEFSLTMRLARECVRPVSGWGKVVLEEEGTCSMKGNIFHLIASDKPFDRWWSSVGWQEGWRLHSYRKHSILNLVDILIPSQTILAELKDALQQNITLSKESKDWMDDIKPNRANINWNLSWTTMAGTSFVFLVNICHLARQFVCICSSEIWGCWQINRSTSSTGDWIILPRTVSLAAACSVLKGGLLSVTWQMYWPAQDWLALTMTRRWTPGLRIPDWGKEMQSPPGGNVRTLSVVKPGTILLGTVHIWRLIIDILSDTD